MSSSVLLLLVLVVESTVFHWVSRCVGGDFGVFLLFSVLSVAFVSLSDFFDLFRDVFTVSGFFLESLGGFLGDS